MLLDTVGLIMKKIGMSFFDFSAVGGFGAAWLNVKKKSPVDVRIRSKQDAAGVNDIRFSKLTTQNRFLLVTNALKGMYNAARTLGA